MDLMKFCIYFKEVSSKHFYQFWHVSLVLNLFVRRPNLNRILFSFCPFVIMVLYVTLFTSTYYNTEERNIHNVKNGAFISIGKPINRLPYSLVMRNGKVAPAPTCGT